jgi:uncharacterized protein
MNLEQFQNETLDGQSIETSRSFVANVFAYMSVALLVSAGVSWYAVQAGWSERIFINGGILRYVVMFAPLVAVLIMSFAFNRLSFGALLGIFFGYAAIMGVSLSYIFFIYDLGAIAKVFLMTAGLFGTMAVIGYTTKTDLTKMGSMLMMALIGMIIASVVNMFMQSSTFHFIISGIGILIFTGLTAYDMQKIKRIGAGVEFGTAEAGKLAIMGALNLYLDFINLFLLLLRFFGRSND